MLKQILAIFTFIFGIFLYGRSSGKKSIEQAENEKTVKQVKQKNKIAQDVHNLSDLELDKLQQKFTRRRD